MRIVKARFAGACYGVQRALDLATEAGESSERAYTLGPLIHNPRVVEELGELGVRVAHSLDDIEGKPTLIIRSHGITPESRDAVEALQCEVVDATCPHVARAQKAAADLARQGNYVVVVGEAGHPEVESLTAYARRGGAEVCVAATPEDLCCDSFGEKVGIVVQTTQRRETLDAIVKALREQGIEPTVKDTICFATRQRQDAAAQVAKEVDAMVVIGGRNSSNTTRLAEICATVCPRTHHVESADEIDPAWFEGCETIGVTAGASTPENHIDALVSALERL